MAVSTVTFHVGDVRDVMAAMPDASVDLIVTSPPFLALRSYLPADHPDKHREIGSEATPAAFLDTLLELTAEWRRLLTPTGSLCVELGDSYSGSGGAGGDYADGGLRDGQPKFRQGYVRNDRPNRSPQQSPKAYGNVLHRTIDTEAGYGGGNNRVGTDRHPEGFTGRRGHGTGGGSGWPLAKSLCGIPTLYTWSLAYGRNLLTSESSPAGQWRIRNLLTWTRPNPPVGALGDKWRPATSFVTVACISERRWFDLDAVRTEHTEPGARRGQGKWRETLQPHRLGKVVEQNPAGAPPLDWHDDTAETESWQPLHRMPTAPYRGAHYATFPLSLPRKLIEAMCPREVCTVCGDARRRISAAICDFGHDNYRPGRVLDPFAGSGTTLLAAALCGRDAIGIDLDWLNVGLTDRRLREGARVLDYKAGRPLVRSDQQGRAGRTPTRQHRRGYLVPNADAIRPVATQHTWTIDGTQPPLPKPKPTSHSQLTLAL